MNEPKNPQTVYRPQIFMLIEPELHKVLEINSIDPEDYVPAHKSSVGLDLYNAGPTRRIKSTRNHVSFTTGNKWKSQWKVLLDTGLRLALPHGWGAFIEERGSVVKTTLKVRAGVIDPGYTGRVFVNCVNLGTVPVTIHNGQKLPFQLVVKPCSNRFTSVTADEYAALTSDSTRKEGKIGSSDS